MSADLAARRTAAAALIADYRRDRAANFPLSGALYWLDRLAAELESLVAGVDREVSRQKCDARDISASSNRLPG